VCRDAVVVGMDPFAEGLRHARRRCGAALVRGDIHHPPFLVRFDLIGLFDVLEHLPDDGAVLRRLHGLLEEGGTLALTVPASPALWSDVDVAARHCRRYTAAGLRDRLAGAGFRVVRCTPFMMSLYPPVWAARKLAGSRGAAAESPDRLRARVENELRVRPGINELMLGILGAEARWLARRRALPFGTSLLAVAARDR
jgi:SAM-dependent methyltransferase